MICPNCEHDNPEGRRYCEECGEKLADVAEMRARARRRSQREAARFRLEAEKKGLDAEAAERIKRRRARRRAPRWMGPAVAAAVVVAVVTAVAVLAVSGGKSEPEKAVDAFYDALEKRDFMKYLMYTEPELYKMAQNGEYPREEHEFEYFYYDRYDVEGLKTELVQEEGDVAKVRLVGGTFKGWKDQGNITNEVDFSANPRLIELAKVEGVWIIPYYKLASEPTNIPEIFPSEPEFPEVEQPAQ